MSRKCFHKKDNYKVIKYLYKYYEYSKNICYSYDNPKIYLNVNTNCLYNIEKNYDNENILLFINQCKNNIIYNNTDGKLSKNIKRICTQDKTLMFLLCVFCNTFKNVKTSGHNKLFTLNINNFNFLKGLETDQSFYS